MAITDDFDNITTPKLATTYLANEWDGLARAIKSCKQIGVALDAGNVTITSDGRANFGDPGLENDTVLLGGATFQSNLKSNLFGGAAQASMIFHRHSSTTGPFVLFSRAKSDDETHTIVADNDTLLSILASGWSGSGSVGYLLGAEIEVEVDGTPSSSAMPARLLLRTTPSGSSTPVTRLTVSADGTVTAHEDLNVGDGAASSGARELTLNSELNNAADLVFQTAGSTFWRLGMGTAQEFTIDSRTGAGCVTIEENAPAGSLWIDADGHVGLGANPTATFDFFFNVGPTIRWDGGAATTQMQLRADAGNIVDYKFVDGSTTEWTLRKTAANDFNLVSDTGACVVVEESAPANALYIDSGGRVGVGVNPTDTRAFHVSRSEAFWQLNCTADSAAALQLQAGDTAQQNVFLQFLDEAAALTWQVLVNSTSNFIIGQTGVNAVFIEDGANANSLYIDADGHVGLGRDPTAAAEFVIDPNVDAGTTMVIDGGSTAAQTLELLFADRGALHYGFRSLASASLFRVRDEQNNHNWLNFTEGGGLQVGAPTGGDKGQGTLNANAVYDDNTLLTCYVYDAAVDGDIDEAKWDALTPNKRIVRDLVDEKGEWMGDEESEEERLHEPVRRFKARMHETLDPRRYTDMMMARKALPAFPDEREWDPVNDKLSMGELLQRLWEEAEVAAIHRAKLLDRVEALENAQLGQPVTR